MSPADPAFMEALQPAVRYALQPEHASQRANLSTQALRLVCKLAMAEPALQSPSHPGSSQQPDAVCRGADGAGQQHTAGSAVGAAEAHTDHTYVHAVRALVESAAQALAALVASPSTTDGGLVNDWLFALINTSGFPDGIPQLCRAGTEALHSQGVLAALASRLVALPLDKPLDGFGFDGPCFIVLRDHPKSRERLRDLGLVSWLVQRVAKGDGGEMHPTVRLLYQLSRSEAVQTSLREGGVLDALLASVLESKGTQNSDHDLDVPNALFTVANLNGGSGAGDDLRCEQVLQQHSIWGYVVKHFDAAVKHIRLYWTEPSITQTVQALSRTPTITAALVEAGLLQPLQHLLGPAGDGRKELQLAGWGLRALLNVCEQAELRARVEETEGLVDAVQV